MTPSTAKTIAIQKVMTFGGVSFISILLVNEKITFDPDRLLDVTFIIDKMQTKASVFANQFSGSEICYGLSASIFFTTNLPKSTYQTLNPIINKTEIVVSESIFRLTYMLEYGTVAHPHNHIHLRQNAQVMCSYDDAISLCMG